ncbi:MAG: hypothetical protein MPN21_09555 [Thermoanaerobaculia bacterium]|nr:hypothetical protein [Thermoanaerobaculia bacterium]
MNIRTREIQFSRYHPQNPKIVRADGPDGLWLVRDLIDGLTWNSLRTLVSCVSRQVGFGTDLVSLTYDDDLDDDETPFEGVRFEHAFEDDVLILSRAEMDDLFARFLETLLAGGRYKGVPESVADWWPELRARRDTIRARTPCR